MTYQNLVTYTILKQNQKSFIFIMPKKSNTRSKHQQEQQEQPNQNGQKTKKEHNEFTLYAFLEVDKKATKEEIKKQYKKLALQYHPDKNKDDPQARQKFQKLKEAYDILIDDERRQQYDQNGIVGDDFNEKSFQSAYEYFRKMFKKVTKEDIQHFETQYRNGPMEMEDLLNYYQEHQGDMAALLQCIPLSTNQDVPRFIAIFEQKISEKQIPLYKAFNKTKLKVRALKNEEKQFQEQQKKGLSELAMAIHSKAEGRVSFLASLEEKYGVGKKKKKQKQQIHKNIQKESKQVKKNMKKQQSKKK